MSNDTVRLWSLAGTDPPTHYAYPDSSHFRLIIPNEYRCKRAVLSFFLSPRQRAKLAVVRLASGLKAAYKQGLYETELLLQIKQLAGNIQFRAALLRGTPGPYTKDTVLFLDEHAHPVAIAKIGASESARCLLSNEARWLNALAEHRFGSQVPSLLAVKELDNCCVLIESIGLGLRVSTGVRREEAEFISRFQRTFDIGFQYSTSTMRKMMFQRLALLKPAMSTGWAARATKTLQMLDHAFNDTAMPMVAAHRDFVPWNMRITPKGLFLFDWEFASEGYIPLYDMYHLLLMPIVLRGDVAPAVTRDVMDNVTNYLGMVEDGNHKITKPDYQLLAYLLDLCLFYLESNSGQEENDQVVQRYGKLIDRFEEWKLK